MRLSEKDSVGSAFLKSAFFVENCTKQCGQSNIPVLRAIAMILSQAQHSLFKRKKMKNSLFKLFAAAVVMLSLLLSVAIGGGVGSSSVQAALIPPNLIVAVFLIALIILPAYVFWRGGETREELRQTTDVICLFVFGAGYACACLQTATLFNPAAQLLVLYCFAIAGMKARTKKFAANRPA